MPVSQTVHQVVVGATPTSAIVEAAAVLNNELILEEVKAVAWHVQKVCAGSSWEVNCFCTAVREGVHVQRHLFDVFRGLHRTCCGAC